MGYPVSRLATRPPNPVLFSGHTPGPASLGTGGWGTVLTSSPCGSRDHVHTCHTNLQIATCSSCSDILLCLCLGALSLNVFNVCAESVATILKAVGPLESRIWVVKVGTRGGPSKMGARFLVLAPPFLVHHRKQHHDTYPLP